MQLCLFSIDLKFELSNCVQLLNYSNFITTHMDSHV